MKRWGLPPIRYGLLLFVVAAMAAVATRDGPSVGSLAPDFTATSYVTGERVRLSEQRGKLVILTFWATWCGPCRKELPNLEKLVRVLGRQRITVLAVNFKEDDSTIQVLARDARKGEWQMQLLRDLNSHVANLYAVDAIPREYLIDAEGRIRATHVGFGDGSLQEMLDDVNAVLLEPAVPAATPAATAGANSPR